MASRLFCQPPGKNPLSTPNKNFVAYSHYISDVFYAIIITVEKTSSHKSHKCNPKTRF